MYIKVENDASLVRDTNSNAILETDLAKLNRYKAIQNAVHQREIKIDDLVEKINKLEQIIERMTNGNTNP
jgi:ribosome-binding protein aMBF1 (putative translation factor)